MRLSDIAINNNIDIEYLKKTINKCRPIYAHYNSYSGWDIGDAYINEFLDLVFTECNITREQMDNLKKQEEEEKKLKEELCANMLITSGFNFDGYTIVKYSGYISGDDAVEIDRGTSGAFFKENQAVNVKDMLMDSLAVIRRNALQELKEKAYDLGCNAVIGVDFDYINLDPETANVYGGTTYLPYIFGVTANGNAVIIKKNDE